MGIKLIVFDLAGTTVDDNIDGLPLVTVAMQEAFNKAGFKVEAEEVNEVRGMEKKEAIAALLGKFEDISKSNKVDTIFANFKLSLDSHLTGIDKEIPGTTNVFHELRSNNVKIALGSGFPHHIVLNITQLLNWTDLVDFISSAETEGHGRPHPCLIHSAMKRFNISDPKEVVKVGDTKLDIQEGKNAGCWTVSVLTGTQGKPALMAEGADFIIDSVADLPSIIQQMH